MCTSAISMTPVHILDGKDGIGSPSCKWRRSSQRVRGTGGRREVTMTHIRLKLWWVPRHELHEVTRSLH